MTRRSTGFAAAALILAGCSGSDTTTRAPNPPASPVVTAAAPAQTPPATSASAAGAPTGGAGAADSSASRVRARTLTVEEARAAYLAAVGPYNTVVERWATLVEQEPDWRKQRPLAGELAEASERFGARLRGIRWPERVRPFAEQHVDDLARGQQELQAIAAADSEEEFIEAYQAWRAQSDSPAADLLRQRLGLPPSPALP